MDNETMLQKMIKVSVKECKELISKHQLAQNKSFIRCLIMEYNVLANTITTNVWRKGELSKKISKLRLIDELL